MSRLDEIFSNISVRVTSDVPSHNYLVKLENEIQINQDVKELMYFLGDKFIDTPKGRAKWRREIAKL